MNQNLKDRAYFIRIYDRNWGEVKGYPIIFPGLTSYDLFLAKSYYPDDYFNLYEGKSGNLFFATSLIRLQLAKNYLQIMIKNSNQIKQLMEKIEHALTLIILDPKKLSPRYRFEIN